MAEPGLSLGPFQNHLELGGVAVPFHDLGSGFRSDKLGNQLDDILFGDILIVQNMGGNGVLLLKESDQKMLGADIVLTHFLGNSPGVA